MRRNSILFLIAAILLSFGQTNVQAQKNKYRNKANDPVEKLGYEKKLRWADGLFKSGSYYNAIDYYKQLLQEQPRNPYLVYQLAESSWYMRDYIPAANYYGLVYSLASDIYPEAIYKQAQMLKMQGKYDEAISVFKQFIKDNPKTFKKLKQRAEREIEGCVMAMNSLKNPIPANVNNLGPNVNSAYTELAPYPLGDTALLFATMHSNEVVEVGKEKRSDYVSRFMVSPKFKRVDIDVVDSFQWPLPFNDGKFNDPKFHTGNGCYSDGGKRFYFTRCLENDKNEMTCHIFVSIFKDEKWGEPEELGNGINEKESSSTHPFIAKIGKKEVLFFSSDRKLQSRGGYDIWYSVYTERQNSYRRPQNAGKQINTVGDEITPYYDSRVNKLYFASNGWVGMGGFDVYSADGGPSRYTNISNLGFPINSSADDLYYIKDPVGKPDAYIVSNRIGSIALKNPTCCDDIWRIQYEPKIYAMGKVLSQKTQQPVGQVVVKMVDENGNLKTFNSEDGQFQFLTSRGHNYELTADKEGYVTSQRATLSTQDIQRSDPDDSIFVTIYVDSLFIDQDFVLKNLLYDYDKADIRAESAASLEKLTALMKDNPSIDIEIYSYTDNKGTPEYNQNLSQERAQSVVEYLVNNGVERSRMTAKGMGNSDPIAPNEVDGKDNPEGRQQNRRTTFRIITDVPTRRTIYDSSKPGTIGEQEKNLEVHNQLEEDSDPNEHPESEYGEPGSRVNEE